MPNTTDADDTAFLAFWLPSKARKAFKHFEKLDRGLHMTIIAMREITPEDHQAILDATEAVCNLTAPIYCETSEIGIMANGKNTVVVNVTAMDGAKLYSELLNAIERRLGREVKRKRDFLPHISLCLESEACSIDVKDFRDFSWTADEVAVQFGTKKDKHTFPLKGKHDLH